MARTIADIAFDIRQDWTEPNYAAAPYLEAMRDLSTIDTMYGGDSARSIVTYFLSNAATWRGPVARSVKAELRALLGRR